MIITFVLLMCTIVEGLLLAHNLTNSGPSILSIFLGGAVVFCALTTIEFAIKSMREWDE